MKRILNIIFALVLVCSCAGEAGVKVKVSSFGTLSDGREALLYRLTNSSGAYVELTDYGARIVSLYVPDRNGRLDDVIVGCGTLDGFENGKERFIGCIIGRYGNRIDKASFSIDGVKYQVDANEEFEGKPVHCHGGFEGFDRRLWKSEPVVEEGRAGVRMSYLSPDGECGYPGNIACTVTYWWTEDNVCRIEYGAETDTPTIVNLSNHAYYNMKGGSLGYIMDQHLKVFADKCIQNNKQLCPDKILPVEGTPFDFREPHRIDYRIDMPNEHLRIMKGMSACWELLGYDGSDNLHPAADLYDKGCGRGVSVWTTEPAFLIYTGRGFDGSYMGKYGPIDKFEGMVLETLHYADSPNQSRFPSTILRPGEKYSSVTEYRYYSK